MKLSPSLFLFFWAVLGAAQQRPEVSAPPEAARLPTGLRLDTVGTTSDLGNMPVKIVPAPGGRHLIVLLSGWREQGVQVVDRNSGRVVQTLPQAAAFFGLVFSPDGKAFYASGGNEDLVYRYAWANGEARPDGKLILAVKEADKDATRYPAGLAISPDGSRLYVAENISDSLAVLDLPSGRVLQRLPTAHYPYDVVVGRDGAVFVSAWGGSSVSAFRVAPRSPGSEAGLLVASGGIEVGRHPSGLLASRTESDSSPPAPARIRLRSSTRKSAAS
jgi:YVTN family beta-propeller protein